jgi:hypothetical protein
MATGRVATVILGFILVVALFSGVAVLGWRWTRPPPQRPADLRRADDAELDPPYDAGTAQQAAEDAAVRWFALK